MKKTLLMIGLGLVMLAVSAQEPAKRCPPAVTGGDHVISPKTLSPDFSTTFTDGSTANLYTTLNAGNTVVLDFFFVD